MAQSVGRLAIARSWLSLAVILLCLTPLQAADTPEQMARAVVRDMVAGRFDRVSARFNTPLKTELPAQTLASVWQQATARIGAFKTITAIRTDTVDALRRVGFICAFERDQALLTIAFDKDGKIAGLTMTSVPVGAVPSSGAH